MEASIFGASLEALNANLSRSVLLIHRALKFEPSNLVFQIYFTDFFLGFEFRNYGLEVINLSMKNQEERLGIF